MIVAGQFDLLVEVVCRDHAHLLEITEQLRAIEGVVSTDTFVYLKLTKQSFEHGAGPGAPERRARCGSRRRRRAPYAAVRPRCASACAGRWR